MLDTFVLFAHLSYLVFCLFYFFQIAYHWFPAGPLNRRGEAQLFINHLFHILGGSGCAAGKGVGFIERGRSRSTNE